MILQNKEILISFRLFLISVTLQLIEVQEISYKTIIRYAVETQLLSLFEKCSFYSLHR